MQKLENSGVFWINIYIYIHKRSNNYKYTLYKS